MPDMSNQTVTFSFQTFEGFHRTYRYNYFHLPANSEMRPENTAGLKFYQQQSPCLCQDEESQFKKKPKHKPPAFYSQCILSAYFYDSIYRSIKENRVPGWSRGPAQFFWPILINILDFADRQGLWLTPQLPRAGAPPDNSCMNRCGHVPSELSKRQEGTPNREGSTSCSIQPGLQ